MNINTVECDFGCVLTEDHSSGRIERRVARTT